MCSSDLYFAAYPRTEQASCALAYFAAYPRTEQASCALPYLATNPGSDSAPNTRAFFEAIGYVFTYSRNPISDAGSHPAAYTRAHGTGKRFIINQFRLANTCFICFLCISQELFNH